VDARDDSTGAPGATLRTMAAMDINAILKCLPHRYPFLMIDKIIEIDGDSSAIGIKNITYNEPIFQGHFPENPIFPGVLLIEGMAQTAGAIAISHDQTNGRHAVYLVTVDKCKFRKPCGPGDRLEFHIKKIRRRSAMGWYEARAMVGDVLIAEAEVGAMVMAENR
jgi:3-hydroxyacyl-[acyl-carrier-protein] dehydratase